MNQTEQTRSERSAKPETDDASERLDRLRRYQEMRRRLRVRHKPLRDAIQASQRLGRDDFAVRVNLQA